MRRNKNRVLHRKTHSLALCVLLAVGASASSETSSLIVSMHPPQIVAPAKEPQQSAELQETVIAIAGQIVATKGRWVPSSRMIVTDVTMQVAHSSSPRTESTVTFTAPGGELPERNMRMTINAIPIFQPQQTLAVTLAPPLATNPTGNYRYLKHRTEQGANR